MIVLAKRGAPVDNPASPPAARIPAMRRLLLPVLFVCLWATASGADDVTATLLKELTTAAKQGTTGAPAARTAWDKLVARGPAVLPALLEAMDTPDTVVANWLRTAFDRIVDDDQKKGGKGIDVDALLAYVKDPKRQGRARRLGLDLVDRLRPGTSDRLIPGWLDDPEFRYEAVALLLKDADKQAKDGQKEKALDAYRKAFAATRDVPQAQTLALRLKELGSPVSIAEHFGFLTDWYVIGPFDAEGMKGFKTAYPPEEKVDLAAELPGKSGKVKWQRYRAKEALTGLPARAALVNLVESFGVVGDAVAYAYTEFRIPAAIETEFRGAADDNLSVWVNGKREFGFEEYRNGVRLDRHRFKVKLKEGVNTVLVKVCQASEDPTSNEPNFEFLLRVVDETGKGIARKDALPAEKK